MSLAPRKDSAVPAERASRARQRQRLIDASIAALHSYGPSRTTVEKVVSIAGLSPGIVSFYFDSKAAMLLAALEHLASEFETEVMAPVAALAARPVEALTKLVELMVDPEIASPRKVSVWYAFWGEATSRAEYGEICGRRDTEFGAVVERLVERLVAETGQPHLDADGIALGLVGALEIVWQSFAFEEEARIDRPAARRRCMAFLQSVFPGVFLPGRGNSSAASGPLPYADPALFSRERAALFQPAWLLATVEEGPGRAGDFQTVSLAGERILLIQDDAGQWLAFRNACARQPHALTERPAGQFGEAIRCQADGIDYGFDGRRLDGKDGTLDRLEVVVVGTLVFVRQRAGDATPVPVIVDPLKPAGAAIERDVAADWKVMAEHWLDRAHSPGIDEILRIIAWTDGSLSYRFFFPGLLVEQEGDLQRLFQLDPVAAGRCRLVWRVLTIDGAAVAWQSVDRAVALAASTQIGLTAPGYRPDDADQSAGVSQFRRWCRV